MEIFIIVCMIFEGFFLGLLYALYRIRNIMKKNTKLVDTTDFSDKRKTGYIAGRLDVVGELLGIYK